MAKKNKQNSGRNVLQHNLAKSMKNKKQEQPWPGSNQRQIRPALLSNSNLIPLGNRARWQQQPGTSAQTVTHANTGAIDQPTTSSNLNEPSVRFEKEILNYIQPQSTLSAAEIAKRNKLINQRIKAIFGRSQQSNRPKTVEDYNVFQEFIPPIIRHETITLDDSTLSTSDDDITVVGEVIHDADADGDITIVDQVPRDADGDVTVVEQAACDITILDQVPRDAEGDITENDTTENDVTFLEQTTCDATCDADGDITIVDQVPRDADGDITVVEQAACDANCDITIVDQVPRDADGDVTVVEQAACDADDELTDADIILYQTACDAALLEEAARDADGDLTVVDQVGGDDHERTSRPQRKTVIETKFIDCSESELREFGENCDQSWSSSSSSTDQSEVIFLGESKSCGGNTLLQSEENNQSTTHDSPESLEDLILLDETTSESVVETSNTTMRMGSSMAGTLSLTLEKVCSTCWTGSQRASGGVSPSPGFGVTPSQNHNQSVQSTSQTATTTATATTPLLTVKRPRCGEEVFHDLLSEVTSSMCNRTLRRWDFVTRSVINGTRLRICSYNVLCQTTVANTKYLYTHLFNTNRTRYISWAHRSTLLAKEFPMINADVFCLQEVQADLFHTFYVPLFQELGYSGKFKKRTREMKDGCAIFVRAPFKLVSYEPVEYFIGTHTLLDRDNVGQIARVRHEVTGQELCIANTHLLFNQKRGDVKLAQLALLLANLNEECKPGSPNACPYIMCGDFNMKPKCPIERFVLDSRMTIKDLKRGNLSDFGQVGGPLLASDLMPIESGIGTQCRFESDKEALGKPSDIWTHPLEFASVYDHITHDQCPEVSACTTRNVSNPDFIFYSIKKNMQKFVFGVDAYAGKQPLVLRRRLSLPSDGDLYATLGPWPNEATPSDHIPLIADFIMPLINH